MMVYTRRVDGKAVALIVMTVVVFGTLLVFFPNTFDDLFGKKFSGENTSGSERLLSYDILIEQLGGYSLLNWVFGIGIGYAYYSVFLSSLINTGLIGMGVFFYIFLKPILRLDNEPISLTTKIGLSCVLFIYIINVSDFYVPPTWMFLGLGYWLLDRRRRAEISSGERDDPPHEEGNVSQSNLVPMEVVR